MENPKGPLWFEIVAGLAGGCLVIWLFESPVALFLLVALALGIFFLFCIVKIIEAIVEILRGG